MGDILPNLDYPDITETISKHIAPGRTESASFLIWYLENYYRLDTLEAVDSVCDQNGDKGVDGIYVNEDDQSINIFQIKISQRPNATIGDTVLKEFHGTLAQFADRVSLQNLINSAGEAQVGRLSKRLDLLNKIETYAVRGYFIANIEIDSNGQSFLDTVSNINFIGKNRLQNTYVSEQRTAPLSPAVTFDILGFYVSEYTVDTQTKALIAPIKAKELVRLDGISNQSIFDYNVRGPLGKTQVNKDIIASIKDPSVHKVFPLFHNGITIICENSERTENQITISNYYVVNGCQSLSSLYDYQSFLTDDLRILTKFVNVNVDSDLSEKVTRYSNNQNGVKARDFKSNNPIQIRLQEEFKQKYNDTYSFDIKRGENSGHGEIISNEIAGLYLMSFDLKEPWGTHRKYQVFEEKHSDLFGRPVVTADRIVLCHVIMKIIESETDKIKNKLFGKYVLTKYLILYIIRLILEADEAGIRAIESPEEFVRTNESRGKFVLSISPIISDIIQDLNDEVADINEDFDYRGNLRDVTWASNIAKVVVSNYAKLVRRGKIDSFRTEWDKINVEKEM